MSTGKPDEPMISVVVCTFNRADLLSGCLDSLVEQTIATTTYEVIVVNNNSTDDTQAIAENYARRFDNISVVLEKQPGASKARNRGVQESGGQYLAFIDDDAKAEPDWLEKMISAIDTANPDICGGSIYPFYKTKKPKWFKDEYEIRQVRDAPGFLREDEYISAANLIFKKDFFEVLGGFDEEIGPKGEEFSYGEETNLLVRAHECRPGCLVYYDPNIRVRHLVPEHKMRVTYFLRSKWAIGKLAKNIFRQNKPSFYSSSARLIYTIMRLSFSLSIGLFIRSRSEYPFWQNYIVEYVAPMYASLGKHSVVVCDYILRRA